ncbi:RIP metalloprotease [Cellulomonas sp. KRMCY2]|uniref:M50 family metallopeptidase n=1 Tax=Cellulomonas sp. KRMCY2 TaxID=1304865 RepID=UPI00045E6B5E|nr:site-2 protease family protein [Cellulomonas sp. KRMCY2]
MAYAVGLLVLLVGLLASIALHEVGHMVPAKRFGVRVSKYMVGFGPTLWSRTRGETEYGVKAIPLGGYVRLVGMYPSAEVVGAEPRAGRFGEVVQAARDASSEEILPGEEHRAFYRLSTPKKVVVMLGGPVMNLLIAFVLLGIVLVGFGIPGGATTTVSFVGECVPATDAPADAPCTASDPPTPAAAAGLEPGDVLLSYGGVQIAQWADFQDAIRDTAGTDIPLVVERAGEQLTLAITPVVTQRPVVDADGEAVVDADGQVRTEPGRYLGVGPTEALERQPLSAVVTTTASGVWETAKIVVTLPAQLVDVVQATLGLEDRNQSSVVGVVGVGRFAGEIASVDAPGFGTAERVVSMLGLLASLNIALFVFNLIPLLPLDGGHVAGALWEGAKRQVARVRGLALPAPADVARMMPLAYGVFLVLAFMGILLIYADIVRPVTIG